MTVPRSRIRARNDAAVRPDGEFILYWMIANRRTHYNFSLQRAIEWSRELNKPLVVLEALRANYRWASDRLHRFILEGMVDNAERLAGTRAHYFPYVEPAPGAGKGLLAALAERACVVVTDDFPCFMLPNMTSAAARQCSVLLEDVDSNGLYPMRSTDREFTRAFSFRKHLQKHLRPHLDDTPHRDPLKQLHTERLDTLPAEVTERWPRFEATAQSAAALPARLPIDHGVPAAPVRGGARAGRRVLARFLESKLGDYDSDRNEPEKDATSRLSPYLHFGHVSVHEVLSGIATRENWTPELTTSTTSGKRTGWWGMSESTEAFLDELVTWRELGFNMCSLRDDYDRYESLPSWALETLEEHASDERSHVYSLEQFERAATHDPLWNAAQTQLVREGHIHNYLRMLWGKKILEWTEHPRDALAVMIELNNKYAVDGRNPNSYSGIFWVLGRYDRAWGPERPIYGKIRYMTSANTARKVRVKGYIEHYSGNQRTLPLG